MDDRAKAKKMFGPGLAIGALVVLLAAFFIIGGGSRDITRLADGSNPTDKDSKLKAMGDGL